MPPWQQPVVPSLGSTPQRGIARERGAQGRRHSRRLPPSDDGLPPVRRPDRSTSSKLRKCSPPSGSLGHPNGIAWTQDAWNERAKLALSAYKDYIKDPRLAAAFARAFPSDPTLSEPAEPSQHVAGQPWTNENGCNYCFHRPLPPPDKADPSHPDNWLYDTGNGAHSPHFCLPFIRFLCEGGRGEVDDKLKSHLQSLVTLRPARQ